MKFSTITNIGKIRNENEDSFSNISLGDLDFFIVADGMGGHSKGELASKLAAKLFIKYIKEADIASYNSYIKLLEEAIFYANEEIYKLSLEDGNIRMGTTVVCLCIDYKNKTYYLSHLGDSRAYIYRNETLSQLTRDHSLVNDLLDSGSLTEDEAANFINKSAITRAVGTEEKVVADSKSLPMEDGDIILMVTDGLTNELTDEKIRQIVKANKDPYQISSKLIEEAIDHGGRDNITVTTILL
ncbi:Stp1/IreP family PP2C-type Ser/Thr phosphatase [Anaerococcus lactolyticus]|uniref:Protein phosphatase 2C n=2 Tax=Anaerococcus lactolyticus TaxID=33032 RepID=C2BCI9_9FIRM|nr:Stp1/IreP family PP2C-type Ser/Thr phosphatase [Anaerococcus lactolyticus]EEI87391.1 protein phosphatase 2C [Anaerococcus lactolyticus ATCC 51172]KGF03537.1 phosphoprotein phosphatase [Anaerococcus lactolyticus S7-1-13]